jgi:hypothetical protein
MSTTYDLCLAWNWEHDAEFVELLEATCRRRQRSLLQITPANLERALKALASGDLGFCAYLDRSSEDDPRFVAVANWARDNGVLCINGYEEARRTWDKAGMHTAVSAVARTPTTLVLPSLADQPVLANLDLTPLGPRFSIKPAHGGGGDGVILGAHSLEQVIAARRQYPTDKYLLQTQVQPVRADARLAWFRVLYCAGAVYPCWWDVDTHVYTPVSAADEQRYRLEGLRTTSVAIAQVCKLRLFSTEIALTDDGSFVVVDYANDPIDLRLQSRCSEGVPDDIARMLAEGLVGLAGSVSAPLPVAS